MQLQGNKGLFCHEEVKAQGDYSNRLPSFGCFEWVLVLFWAKKGRFGAKMRSFGRAPPDLVPLPRGATGEFLAQILDLASHHLGSRMARSGKDT